VRVFPIISRPPAIFDTGLGRPRRLRCADADVTAVGCVWAYSAPEMRKGALCAPFEGGLGVREVVRQMAVCGAWFAQGGRSGRAADRRPRGVPVSVVG
jgi:hypothetical protein